MIQMSHKKRIAFLIYVIEGFSAMLQGMAREGFLDFNDTEQKILKDLYNAAQLACTRLRVRLKGNRR